MRAWRNVADLKRHGELVGELVVETVLDRNLLVVPGVARLSVARFQEEYRITVRGLLCAADLRRFERACSRALEQRTIALQVQLDAAGADEPAWAFLERLRDRGAVILE